MGAAGQAEKQEMEAALRAMLTEEGWRHLLDLRAHPGHRYSLNNIAWLCGQAMARDMSLTEVRGYRAWEAVGRHVRRGEKALRVLAPVTAKVTPKPDDPAQATEGEPQVRVVGWRAVPVFDIAQTDGPPLPSVSDRLDAGDPTDLAERIRGYLAERGWEVRTAPRSEMPVQAHGVTRPHLREVVVADDLSPAQAAAVLAHELAHTLLPDLDGPISELAAESFAFILCRRAGLDVSEIAFPYLGVMASATTPDEIVRQVTSAADVAAKLADEVAVALGLAEPEPPAPEHTPPQHRRTRRAVREREAVPAGPTYSPPAVATTGPGLSA
jgi:antirestriction protein ArdC